MFQEIDFSKPFSLLKFIAISLLRFVNRFFVKFNLESEMDHLGDLGQPAMAARELTLGRKGP